MGGYKHYIRLNEAGEIILGFSDAFPEIATPQDGDILILEDGPRHFSQVWPETLMNERGQFQFKWVDGERVERTQEELDTEWAQRPPESETAEQKIERLEQANTALQQRLAQVNGDFTAFTDFYFEKNPEQA